MNDNSDYILERIDYTTDEPSVMVFSSIWNKSHLMGHFCNDAKILPRTTYNCVLKVSDGAGNLTEAPFSFTTGPGVVRISLIGAGPWHRFNLKVSSWYKIII